MIDDIRDSFNEGYKKGYADGYRRRNQQIKTNSDSEYQYFWTVSFIIITFLLFLVGILYTYGPNSGKNSHYEGDCLIDLATNYSSKCLDN